MHSMARAIGIETEYALGPDVSIYGRMPSRMTMHSNGGLTYVDNNDWEIGFNVEHATPECSSPREAALYEAAGHAHAFAFAGEIAERTGIHEWHLFKNNIGSKNNIGRDSLKIPASYATHVNV